MVQIQIDYRFDSTGFFTEQAKTAFESAAQIWSDLLQDDFEEIPVGAEFTIQNPTTGETETIVLENPIDDILLFVGANNAPFNGQGENTISIEGGHTDYCSYCDTSPQNNGHLSQLGLLGSLSTDDLSILAQAKPDGVDLEGDQFQRRINPDTTDFEPWAGVISFSNNLPTGTEWDFSLENPDPNKFDFISVALHEIGHVLGIGVTPTFFNLVQDGLSNGVNAKNVNNGQGIPLEPDFGHVQEGFAGNRVLMDPILGEGRFLPTNIDLALLADIGYEIEGFTKQGSVPDIATEGNETIFGSLFNDDIDGLGGNDQLQGNQGDDTLIGGAGDDIFFGGVGQDSILGGDGNDSIFGNQGKDTIEGGAGNDLVFGDQDTDDIIDSDIAEGKENDLIFGDGGNDNLLGGVGDDTIRGNDDNDTISGEQGNDLLFGNSGDDELQGGEDNDYLRGGDANDTLFGDNGNDTLEGGTKDDALIGGAGSDRFDFGFSFGNDRIQDYIVAEDSLRFSAKYDFETQSYDLTDASQIIDSITETGNVIDSQGNPTGQFFTKITLADDRIVTIFHDNVPLTADEIEIYRPLQVSFKPTSNGFELQFNESLNTSVLNSVQQDNQSPDLEFTNSAGEIVDGSFVFDENDPTRVTFVKTDGLLEIDTYNLTLFSRENGFVSTEGKLLDGDNDGIEGDNFLVEFEVDRFISIEDISRGKGQTITNPKTNEGLIVSLNNGADVSQISLTLNYNPNLLNLNDIVLDPDLNGWSFESKNLDTPGTAIIDIQGTTPLDSGAVDLLQLQGTVNAEATYGISDSLILDNLSLNGGNINVLGNNGLLNVANLGDTNGDENYSNNDVFLISQLAAGITDSLDNFSNIEPGVIADINGDGFISAFDAYLVSQRVNGATDFIL